MTRKATGGAKLRDQVMKTLSVIRILGVEPLQATFQPERCEYSGSSVTGTDDVNEVEVVLLREVIKMGIHEGETRACSPVSK
jgi:hypothetical protein